MNKPTKPRNKKHAPFTRRHALCGKVAFSHSLAHDPSELTCPECYAIIVALVALLVGDPWARWERFMWNTIRPPIWLS